MFVSYVFVCVREFASVYVRAFMLPPSAAQLQAPNRGLCQVAGVSSISRACVFVCARVCACVFLPCSLAAEFQMAWESVCAST